MAAISYVPSDQHAFLFWEKHHNQEYAESKVPEGFPEKLVSPLAWTRADIEKKQSEWILKLGKDDIEKIDAALASFEAQSLDLSQISPSTFILPESLATLFKQVTDQVYNGIGFNVIHGLDPARYTPEQNVIIYAGIAAHVAHQRGFLDRNSQRVLC